jgi:hypothetical protein
MLPAVERVIGADGRIACLSGLRVVSYVSVPPSFVILLFRVACFAFLNSGEANPGRVALKSGVVVSSRRRGCSSHPFASRHILQTFRARRRSCLRNSKTFPHEIKTRRHHIPQC